MLVLTFSATRSSFSPKIVLLSECPRITQLDPMSLIIAGEISPKNNKNNINMPLPYVVNKSKAIGHLMKIFFPIKFIKTSYNKKIVGSSGHFCNSFQLNERLCGPHEVM